MKKTRTHNLISAGILIALFVVAGCGPRFHFSRAKKHEKEGRHYRAWELYQEFAARYPKHKYAAEALFRAGWVAQKGMGDCYGANIFYEKVLVQYPQSEPWAKAASLQPMNCPDYFPLIPGSRWVEGDSDTKGHNAKVEITCRELSFMPDALPSQAGRLEKTFYAGKKKFRDTNFIYKKEKGELLEFMSANDSRAKVMMKWPIEIGTKWRTRMAGRFFNFEIVSVTETVDVAAGHFEDCLKIKATVDGGVGTNYEYYAPGVGHVMTTLASRGGERRNMELMSVEIGELPEFEAKDEDE